MRIFSFLLFVFFIASKISAQYNLVPNYSFEDYNACPVSYSAFGYDDDIYADIWLAGSGGTSDYFNSCADISTQVSVPSNIFSLDQPAHTGEAYAGFWTDLYDNNSFIYREYVQVKLIDTLKAGKCYYVEFWSAPATQSDFIGVDHATTDAIGAYFDDNKIGNSFTSDVLDYTPQIENNGTGNYIDQPGEWTKICGFFTAEGGEQWICIGNFHPDDEVECVAYDGGTLPASPLVYLFVDDVFVTPLDSLVSAFLKDTVVCAPITLTAPTCADSYLWSTGETTQEITVTESGDYWLELETSCGPIRDTAEIIFTDVPTYISSHDTIICFTDLPYIIEAFSGYAYYEWNTGEHTSSITVDEPGVYYLTAYGDCEIFIDTFHVDVIEPIGLDLDLGNDTLICAAPGWSLDLNAPAGFSEYLWSTGATTDQITVTETGTYELTITTDCEIFTDEITVTDDPNFGATINLGDDIELCPPAGINTAELIATPGLPNYLWSNGSVTNSITVSQAGLYTVTSVLLCNTISDEVRISICNDIYIPNAFSPNGDGVNDLLQLIVVDPSKILEFQIYNRWGEIVYDGDALNYTWDGTYNDIAQPMGVYVYALTYIDDDGFTAMMQGNITLVK